MDRKQHWGRAALASPMLHARGALVSSRTIVSIDVSASRVQIAPEHEEPQKRTSNSFHIEFPRCHHRPV